ncbi:MAG TPA: iron-containing alcohol dehydrogenase [Dongiaceae bacterium]|nr:iron-containing alcohol dehydrogenase [Dongiaceae bacterium]
MILPPFNFGPTTPVAFGIDGIERIADDVTRLCGAGAPVLLVSDPGIPALAERVEGLLKAGGHRVAHFQDVRSDPLSRQIDAAAELARRHGARLVVCLGGGSALDVGKMAAAIAPAGQPADHYALAANPLPAHPLKKICIPTTSGTGSETTRTSVFSNDKGEKVWGWGDGLAADLALLDPRLTLGLPAHLTAATGIDALVHAIEAVTIRRANPMNDSVGLHAIRLIARHLPRAVVAPDDLEARAMVQIAAAAAGIAIDNAGTGVAHALGHALGAIGHVHHGRAVGLSLRVALAWNAEAAPARHAAVAAALGVPTEGRGEAAVVAELGEAFDRFVRSTGLAISLAGDGLGKSDSRRLAQAMMAPENKPMRESNCRSIAEADAVRLSEAVLTAA